MQEPVPGRRRARLVAGAIIIAAAGCGSEPLRLDDPVGPRADARLAYARSIAARGVPSPTPQLDAMAAALSSATPALRLPQLLAAPEERLRPGDQVLVTCVSLPELSGERTLGHDGCVSGPVELIQAAGMTPPELAAAVQQQLATTFTQKGQHEVSVRLLARAPRSVQVLGRVGAHVERNAAAAGPAPAMATTVPMPPDRPMSVYELLSLAQGLAADADGERLTLVRQRGAGKDAKTRCYHFSFRELVDAHLSGREALLEAGDQLVVPRLPDVFVYGEVVAPGRYTCRPGTTVASLLLLAGGTTLEADMASAMALGRDGSQAPAGAATVLGAGAVLFVPQVQRVYVVGMGVKNNGPLVLPASGLTAIQAISEAGWFTQFGDMDGVQILRVQDGRRVAIDVPVEEVLEGEVDERDFLLRPGDTVLVEEGIW